MMILIKNMVCNRCIAAVESILDRLQIEYRSVGLGEVTLKNEPSDAQLKALDTELQQQGFELLDDNRKKIIEKIKNIIIDQVHYGGGDDRLNLSALLSEKIRKDYSFLSKLFSEVEGITIEKYFIHQKIEKVKELLVYDEKNLSEIAFEMGYSSIAHLSAQFKKVTGLTPTHFKNLGGAHRKPLDRV